MVASSVTLFGPLDTVIGPYVSYVVLALVVANFATRKLAYDRYARQAADGDGAITRFLPHVATNWLLVLAAFYYLTLHHHSGIVLATLVLGLFGADFFEFESRRVEAREDLPVERPRAAIGASLLVLLYAAYLALFGFVQPLWSNIV